MKSLTFDKKSVSTSPKPINSGFEIEEIEELSEEDDCHDSSGSPGKAIRKSLKAKKASLSRSLTVNEIN
jgi:hypothetical protein